MNVLIVSQCSKNALPQTRRILDQFAERRGERTWQTPITQAGLNTLRSMLRKSARKNTAVACHWVRGHNHSELLWIVGNASKFNLQGAVPTNTTSRDILRRHDENDWHTGEDVALLSCLAALLHDMGKACVAFQKRLTTQTNPGRNHYRHEWISLRLFQAFVGDDDDQGWLERLCEPSHEYDHAWTEGIYRDGIDRHAPPPFSKLPPIAAAVGWLIVTHHRLPLMPPSPDASTRRLGERVSGFRVESLRGLPAIITSDWNELPPDTDSRQIAKYWRFDHALPVVTTKWKARASQIARRLLGRLGSTPTTWLDNLYAMHLARMSLMLADHHYSSLTDPQSRVRGQPDFPVYANTDRRTGALNQPLDEHLLGVASGARSIVRALPRLALHLPRLARHKGFRKRSTEQSFRWQNRAFDLATSIRDRTVDQGFFGLNMASTGCGKTLANGRIAYGLADPTRGTRFSIALGLRTLTLQTGRAYRELMNLGEDELAIRVGGSANRMLFEHFADQAERHGSASAQALMEEDGFVYFAGEISSHPVLNHLGQDPALRSLISAPILACTVDHLIPATEGLRGGRQIAPMIRLMTSDLILDEIDDFGLEDLPALTRLVHWAGLLGSRVLLSSATLPPAIVEGLFDAYRSGRVAFQQNRGHPGIPVSIPCAWFDEHAVHEQDCQNTSELAAAHNRFAAGRHRRLGDERPRRRAAIAPVDVNPQLPLKELTQEYGLQLLRHALTLHDDHHIIDPATQKRVSFGLIRMANIEPLVEVARTMYREGAPDGYRLHICVYHSRFPMLVRSEIERHLDRVLYRKDPEATLDLPKVREHLKLGDDLNHVFLVLGSPVTEVGRDHDYDWAVVEPSSMRSIIQLAGRIGRHRSLSPKTANILIASHNIRAFENKDSAAFIHPGFEGDQEWRLHSHDIHELLRPSDFQILDSRPRLLERSPLDPRRDLVDLEHARLRATLDLTSLSHRPTTTEGEPKRLRRRAASERLSAASWYQIPFVALTGVLQQNQPFRAQTGMPEDELLLAPDELGETWRLQWICKQSGKQNSEIYADIENSKLTRVPLDDELGPRIRPWITRPYLESLIALAEELDQPIEECARRFGTVSVPRSDNGWFYADALGFWKKS